MHCNTEQGKTGGVQGNPVMKAGLSCKHYIQDFPSTLLEVDLVK